MTLSASTTANSTIARESSRGTTALRQLRRFARRQPLGAVSAAILIVLVIVAVFAPLFAPYSEVETNVGPTLSGPSVAHPFGTDNLGRDVLSRIIFGARISIYVGLGAPLLGVMVGTLVGTISAYLGGVVDLCLQRFIDAVQALPALVLLIAVMIVLGGSLTNVILALAMFTSVSVTRVVRSAVISIRSDLYIEAARSLGASSVRIVLRHIIPNTLPTVIVLFSVGVGSAILAEASLSFLGYGAPPPAPSWGGMISVDGRLYMLAQPYLLVFPVLALSAVVFAANLFGDAMRDELDPRLRGR